MIKWIKVVDCFSILIYNTHKIYHYLVRSAALKNKKVNKVLSKTSGRAGIKQADVSSLNGNLPVLKQGTAAEYSNG